jgi:hypothetical protein
MDFTQLMCNYFIFYKKLPKQKLKIQDSIVGIAIGYKLEDRRAKFESQWVKNFLLATSSILALGPIPIQWVPWAHSLGVKWCLSGSYNQF